MRDFFGVVCLGNLPVFGLRVSVAAAEVRLAVDTELPAVVESLAERLDKDIEAAGEDRHRHDDDGDYEYNAGSVLGRGMHRCFVIGRVGGTEGTRM